MLTLMPPSLITFSNFKNSVFLLQIIENWTEAVAETRVNEKVEPRIIVIVVVEQN